MIHVEALDFIVSHNGKVFEKDLGRNTAVDVANLSAFDPRAGCTSWLPESATRLLHALPREESDP